MSPRIPAGHHPPISVPRTPHYSPPAALDDAVAAATAAFPVALLGSVLLHAFIIFGIAFKLPDMAKLDQMPPPLEVVLVNAKSATRPTHADRYAQNNLEGGGTVDEDRHATSPLPLMNSDQTNLQMQEKRLKELEREKRRLLTQVKSPVTVSSQDTHRQTEESQPTPDAADLVNRSLEIARLQAQIDRNLDTYEKRPRRKFLGGSTIEYRYTRYIEEWKQKIERIGTMNYPADARDKGIHGSLMVTVSIRKDGSVENVEINRSSGYPELDRAARRTIELAAPYARLPEDRDADIISITKTWSYTENNELGITQ